MTIYSDECYTDVVRPQAENSNDGSALKEFVTNGGYDYMSQLEEDYSCASICYKPLFYLTKSIEEAPVEKECVSAFIEAYAGNMGVGIVAIVTGLVLLSACIGSVPLCTGFATGAMG